MNELVLKWNKVVKMNVFIDLYENQNWTYFLVMSFLPLTNVVEVDVRFIAPWPVPLLNDEIDEIDENPFGGSPWWKKSSISETPMNGLINDDKIVLFCGWEWRWWPLRRPGCPIPVNVKKKIWINKRHLVDKTMESHIIFEYTYCRQKVQQMVNWHRKILWILRRASGRRSQNQNLRNHVVVIDDDVRCVQANHPFHIDRRRVSFSLQIFAKRK